MPINQRSMQNQKPLNIHPKRILVITLRYLGDTLLVTPLIRSLKQAYADAEIDVLLPAANAGMLEGNPDIRKLIPLPSKPSLGQFLRLLFGIRRSYDLAISTQAGDRPTLIARTAGKTAIGFVPDDPGKAWWKNRLLDRSLVFGADYDHAVLENLRFCDVLNIEPCYRLNPPQCAEPPAQMPANPYVVLHIMPQWRYKQWHRVGWLGVMAFLNRSGYQLVLTGSGQPAELESLRELERQLAFPVTNMAGQLSLAQLAALIGQAALFIGPDTGITHLAAATGTETIALYGPTDPKKWAPWPCRYVGRTSPFASVGSKRIGNVYLLQGGADRNCVPCQLEGCDRHRNSHSECLDRLPASLVIETIAEVLRQG
ncbi:glycosyl transferase [Methylomonas sp. DH-1]|nr:glycosyl transferase [Methylomonas sp. DH-1]